jgi:hypothetical protein
LVRDFAEMAQVKRKAEDELIPEDKEKKKTEASFRRPLFIKIAYDDGTELVQMHIEYLYDTKTPGCVDIPTNWVFAGEVFPFLYEAIGYIIPSRSVCGIIAGYCSSHENTGQQVWIHSCYKHGKERRGYPKEAITIYDTIDEKAVCCVSFMNDFCRGDCKCAVSSCRKWLWIGRDRISYGCYDVKAIALGVYRCPHIVYSCEYVVPCLSYL